MRRTEPALVEMCRISVMRGSKTALADVDLTIEAGEHVAIFGPNGCGEALEGPKSRSV